MHTDDEYYYDSLCDEMHEIDFANYLDEVYFSKSNESVDDFIKSFEFTVEPKKGE